MAFNFPDPAVSTTATNPVTGAKYQWRADPGKWVLTGGPAEASNPPVTIDLLPPDEPQKGDLWIHEETLIEYAWDGTQWFEVGSSCGGDTKEEEEEEKEPYHPFVNSFKLLAPDDFNGKKGTATILTTAYDAGDDSYLSPTVKSVRFASIDLNDRKLELAIEGETIQLTPDNQSENGDKTLYGELEVTTVTVGSSSTTYDVDFDINRSVIYTEGDIVHYRIATVEEPPYQPFIGRYKLVAPDDYTGEDGTATVKTLAYSAGDDTFLSSDVQEAYFASVDLDGRQHDSIDIDETFDLAPQTLSTNTKSYGTYLVNGTTGPREYTVETTTDVYFTEGDVVYFRKATSDQYVRKVGGDTMEGQLIINGPRNAGDDVDNPNLVSSLKVLNIDNAQNSALQLRHSGKAKVYIGDTDVSVASDIKFNRAQPSIVKSGVQDLLLISNEEIAYLGKSIEDDDLVTKKYVDETDEELRQDILELEQEIDAIAPSVERGEWQYIDTGLSTNAGSYSMNTDTLVAGLGDPADIFAAVENIVINEKDKAGTIHSFANVEAGQLLEIFEATDADYGLYEILDVTKQLGGGVGLIPAYTYWSFDVALVSTGQGDKASGLARFKIFSPPEGGTADGFVLKSGDTMTGTLEIKLENDGDAKLLLQGKQNDANRSSGTIQFNNQNVNQIGYLTYYTYGTSHYFRFNRDLELSTKLRTNEITTRSGDVLVFDKKMDFTQTTPVNARFRRGFVVKKAGEAIDGDNIFSAYNDYVEYEGPIDTDTRITNKKYVDDQIKTLLARIEELENNSSSGGSAMGNNVKVELTTASWSPGFGEISTISSGAQGLTLVANGISLQPRGRIHIVEKGVNGATTPVFLFNITSVTKNPYSNLDADKWDIGVAQDSPGVMGAYSIYERRTVIVSFLDGAASDDPAIGRATFTVDQTDIVNTNNASLVANNKAYNLDASGNLNNTVYQYGLFLPYDYLNSTPAKGSGFGVYRVTGLDESTTANFLNNTIPKEKVEERTINGIKGIAFWHYSYTRSNVEVQFNRIYIQNL